MAIDIRLPLLAQAPDTSQTVALGIETFRQARLDPYRQALLQMQVESNRAAAERSRLLAPLEAQAQKLAIEEAQFQASPEQRALERRRSEAAASLSESQAKLMGVQAELAPGEQSLRRLQLEAQREAAEAQAERFKAEQTEAKNKVYESFAARVSPLLDQLETSDDPTVAGAAFAAFDKIASTMLSPEDAQEIVGSAGLPEVRGFIRAMAPKQVKEQKELTTQDIAKLDPKDRAAYLNAQAQSKGTDTKTVGNNIFKREFVVQDGKVESIIKPIEGATPDENKAFLDALNENPGVKKYYAKIGEQLAETELNKPVLVRSSEEFLKILDRMIKNTEGRTAFHGKVASLTPELREATIAYKRDFEQLKGSLFLNTVPKMSGMGSLSNAEGSRINDSATNLAQELSPENALKALTTMQTSSLNIEETINSDIANMRGLLANPVISSLQPKGSAGDRPNVQQRILQLISEGKSKEEVTRQLKQEGLIQ